MALDIMVATALLNSIGSPLMLGILAIIFIIGLVFMLKLSLEAGIVIFVGGMMFIFDQISGFTMLKIITELALAFVVFMLFVRVIRG